MKDWRSRYADGRKGVCDFGLNYDFYFKWLTNKVISCFVIRGAPETINDTYLKTHLVLDGNICITDFDEKLYDCIGNWGGKPDEHYIPTQYIIANPVLGSKTVDIGKNGVVITNTSIDGLGVGLFGGGLYDLIHQTATLLADNIVSISCQQINARVQNFFIADGEAEAISGENILKKMYAGSPYQILRQDLVKKITVNPVATSSTAQNITQLVELHNYIIANFFQSIGIKSNNIMKKERLITDEIESQDDFVQLSVLEIISSWQKGFDKVNELYGTDITVELNPVLIKEIADEFMETETEESVETESIESEETEDAVEESNDEVETVETVEDEPVTEYLEAAEVVVEEIIDIITDDTSEEVVEDVETE